MTGEPMQTAKAVRIEKCLKSNCVIKVASMKNMETSVVKSILTLTTNIKS